MAAPDRDVDKDVDETKSAVESADEAPLNNDGEPDGAKTDTAKASEVDANEEQVDDESDIKEDSELEKVKKELEESKDKYLRLQAEWDNYRKRTAQERQTERQRATEKLVCNLLQVLDDLERAIDNAPGGDDDPMLAGVKAVRSKMFDILAREGLEAVDPSLGDAFDIQLHQAVGTVEDTDQPDESINEIYQKGYIMGGKILRPAMVTVTKGGPVRPSSKEE